MKRNHFGTLAMAAAVLLSSSVRVQSLAAEPSAEDENERQVCIKQLEKIHQAIQAYRRDHKDLPNWLSDLVPKYIPDNDQLICPVTKRTKRTHQFQHLRDPKLPNAYLYEFSLLPMGDVWQGGQIRMRDYKRRQMGLLGGEVPIVRCHLHDPVLNLAFSGRIYESGLNWEENFTDYVDFQQFQMAKLFPETAPKAVPQPQPISSPRVIMGAEKTGPETLVGEPAPQFTLPLLEGGGTFDLASYRDKQIVLLDFWATWCGPCRVAMPTLVEVSRDYAAKGVRYFAVNLREKPDVIRKYLKEANLDIVVPLDQDGSIARKYNVQGIPTMVIVGKDGKVKKVHVGSSPELKQELTRALDEILAENNRASSAP